MKRLEIYDRAKNIGRYIVDRHTTVRVVAKKFDISKSTVHVDLTERLPKLDYQLYLEARTLLDQNKSERHLRGGEATKQKYLKVR